MLEPAPPFRIGQPLAWTFHRGTARWVFNTPAITSPAPLPGRENPAARWTVLPSPLPLTRPLGEVLAGRVSSRAFAPDGIGLVALSTILYWAYGMLGRSTSGVLDLVERPVPSAGGLYPLEISVLVRAMDGIEPGVYHYVPLAGGLEEVRAGALPQQLVSYLFMGQPWVAQAAVVLIVSAATDRSLSKYGDRGYRYLLAEVGHVVQNLDLVATALGLGAVNLGGFFDDEVAGLLRLDEEREIPLYAAAVGVPATLDRIGLRAIPAAVPGG
jgi:SagB-type dehydrogenase family enzyme